MRKLFTRVGVLAGALAAVAAVAPAANAGTVHPNNIGQFNCNLSPNYTKLYTEYHGNPACFGGSGGRITFGVHPPRDTWTTYTLCSGNNWGNIVYYEYPDYKTLHYYDFSRNSGCKTFSEPPTGNAIEVQSLTLNML